MRFARFQSRSVLVGLVAAGLGAGLLACSDDGGSGGDAAVADDGGQSDAGRDANVAHDSSVPDGTTVVDASKPDATQPVDASDASSAVDAADATAHDAATDAAHDASTDASDASHASDASDASTVTDASDAGHSGDASDGGGDAGLCGNGTVNGGEQCDLGTSGNTGAYGGCNADCTRGAYCGDNTTNGPETCDLGTAGNTGGYGGCKSDCTLAAHCGDGTVNGSEQCDLGTASNNGFYGGCKSDCTLAPHCGDGVVTGAETCDQGSANSDTIFGACTTTCGTTPLLMWLDASDPNGNGTLPADNTQLAAWFDKARGRSVVQGSATQQPTFVKSGIAGKPAFLFDGIDDFFDADLDINGSVLPNLTVVVVFQNTPGDTSYYSGVWGQDDGGWDRFIASGGTSGGNGISNGGGFTPVNGLLADSIPLVTTAILASDGNNASSMYVNGVLGATFTGSTNPGDTHMSIGNLNGPSEFASGWSFDGYIAEVRVYGTALSDADRTTLEASLIAKYTP